MKPWLYDVEKEKKRLERIRDRYFRPVISHPEGNLTHHADCSVYRAIQVYGTAACTCGLLHDLRIVSESLTTKLHPKYYEELRLEDGPPTTLTDEQREKNRKMFEEIFPGPAIGPSPAEWEDICRQDWGLIEEVFGGPFRQRREAEWLALDDEGY